MNPVFFRIAVSLSLLALSRNGVARAVDPFKELVIVDPLVVEDKRALPGGPWHFGTLIREMLPQNATPSEITQFVREWVEAWEVTEINGFSVTPRPQAKNTLFCPWVNASTGGTDCQGNLDLKKAPFRLLAILNRMDVRQPTNAGEGRMVFSVLAQPTENPLDPMVFSLSFTILVDYVLPMTGSMDAKKWADLWHRLGSLPCTTNEDCESYRGELNALTDRFTRRGVSPGNPNGSALSEIRTNEIALASPWELREFRYVDSSGRPRLIAHTVNKTPDPSLNNKRELVNWASDNEDAILQEKHVVPKKFLGGSAPQSFGTEFKWMLDGLSEEVRFKFSKNTCNGCHREESDKVPPIDGFYHLSPQRPAGIGRLSPFVLNEDLPRRKLDFETLLEGPANWIPSKAP